MALIVPVFVVEQELTALKGRLAAFAGVPMSEQSAAVLKHEMDLLKRLLDAGEAAADDLLDRDAAMNWSGLKKDALDGYPSTGSYGAKRWRRGDLPMRHPFAVPGDCEEREGPGPCDEPNSGASEGGDNSLSKQERLRAALAEAQRAA